MTDLNQLVEVGARVIAPRRWEVMDGYLEQTKRKYAGQHVGWPADQFKDKESMAQFRAALLATLPLLADDLAGVAEEQAAHAKRLALEDMTDTRVTVLMASERIAHAIRNRIAAIIEGEGK